MTTFGLVHGAWHGAACFERLVSELEGGHSPLLARPADLARLPGSLA